MLGRTRVLEAPVSICQASGWPVGLGGQNLGACCLWSLKYSFMEFPLWLRGLRMRHCLHEDAGLIPGLDQWVKDLELLQLLHRSQMQLRSNVAVAVA